MIPGRFPSGGRRHPRLRPAVGVLMALILTACAAQPQSSGEGEGVLVVATTTILGDVMSGLVGDGGRVETLMPVGVDPHEFQLSARQAALIRDADLVVANGLGLEEQVLDALKAARSEGVEVLELAPLVEPLPFGGGDNPEQGLDPHFWFDPVRMARAVRLTAQTLDEIAPSDWVERGEAYAARLEALDAEIADILAAVPPERRKLVTNHDSFEYFARRYGFRVVGVVIPGGSTLAEPSAAELTGLVDLIRREGVPAIFVEREANSRLAESIVSDLGGQVRIVELYSDSLGEPGSGAETYPDMLRENARRIAGALS